MQLLRRRHQRHQGQVGWAPSRLTRHLKPCSTPCPHQAPKRCQAVDKKHGVKKLSTCGLTREIFSLRFYTSQHTPETS